MDAYVTVRYKIENLDDPAEGQTFDAYVRELIAEEGGPDAVPGLGDPVGVFSIERMNGCGGCGGSHRFDTSVPSVLWNCVIRAQGLSEYLCTACIVREFARAGVSFTATLWGDGFDGVPIAVEINGAVSTAAHKLSEENSHLRATLIAIQDRVDSTLDAVQKVSS